jgi:arylsulfatase A-like enzyme
VRSLGIEDNTYIFLMADNGAVPVLPPDPSVEMGQNDPLRRGKWSLLEGGLRVPFIAAGPGIQAGTQCDVPVVGWDLLPTFGELAGFTGKLPPQIDGFSLTGLLRNPQGRIDRSGHPLAFHLPHRLGAGLQRPHSAIRAGDWKLIRFMDNGQLMLFHLAEDLGEKNDLAAKSAANAHKLEQQLMAYLRAANAQLTFDPNAKTSQSDE